MGSPCDGANRPHGWDHSEGEPERNEHERGRATAARPHAVLPSRAGGGERETHDRGKVEEEGDLGFHECGRSGKNEDEEDDDEQSAQADVHVSPFNCQGGNV